MNAIIAFNPQQMAEAQTTTIGWADAKLASAKQELETAESVHSTLQTYGLRVAPAVAQMDKAERRIKFYEKVKAALAAGYYVIPPFDIQVFAIRTDRVNSPDERGTRNWVNEMKPRSLPVGAGRYVDPVVQREEVGKITEKNRDGTAREVTIFQNTNWRDEINLPVRAMKPTIIEAVGRALEEKIFDALGIAPAYRAADPIIAGQIKRPDGKGVLTFFVAWWLDESDL